MTPTTSELFKAIVSADIVTVQRALAAGADVNATDGQGRSVVSYAALGTAIDTIDLVIQPRLSEHRLDILRLITQQPELSLYSLNAPMEWVGGVTLLSLMSWLNMPSEMMCLLEFTHGLLEVNAMDVHGATPLMYAARDGNLQVVQRLLAHGARPDLKDVSQRSAIEYALPHPQVQWLCEEALRRSRRPGTIPSSTSITKKLNATRAGPNQFKGGRTTERLFFCPQRFLIPPSMACFDVTELRRTFDTLLRAIRRHNVDTFRNILVSSSFNSGLYTLNQRAETPFGTVLLVNSRDSTGLTLVHHVVCQRPFPNTAILDALHSAGSDVGLFSTLGFSPLHHLSRTARDVAKGAAGDQGLSRSSLDPRTHPLYTFTMHLIRDLRAPLCAKDSRGETPLHAAAEHGHSLSVLLAMLECDKDFSEKASVREMRNERGLRPVDVARSEFKRLFLGRHLSHPTLQSSLKRPVSLFPNNQQHMLGNQVHGTSHVRSDRVVRQRSHSSLMSKSSGSSSMSSGANTIGSQLSAYWSRPHRCYTPTITKHALPTPEGTPPGSITDSSASPRESYFPIDAPACAVDVLDHLTFCASALHAYTQLYTDRHSYGEIDAGPLPDFHALADLLLFTRDVASHVLDHWTAKLDSARDEFERAQRELSKAHALKKQVGRDIKIIPDHSGSYVESNGHVEVILQAKPVGLRAHSTVQADLASSDTIHPSELSLVMSPGSCGTDKATPTLKRVTPGRRLGPRLRTSFGEESVDMDQRLFTSESDEVSEVECPVGQEATSPTPKLFSESEGTPFFSNHILDARLTLPQGVPKASVVLQRVDQDLSNVLAYFVFIQQSYAYAQETIAQTHALVEESIKVREDKLNSLVKLNHGEDVIARSSSRLSPILERSSDAKEFDGTSSVEPRIIAALGLIEENPVLRRLLMRKLAKHVGRVFDHLQKAHVWLRIIREVLRGLRRRAITSHSNK